MLVMEVVELRLVELLEHKDPVVREKAEKLLEEIIKKAEEDKNRKYLN